MREAVEQAMADAIYAAKYGPDATRFDQLVAHCRNEAGMALDAALAAGCLLPGMPEGREEAVEVMYGTLCEMVAFDSTEDPERARAVTIHMLDAALASGFVVLRSGDLCLECGADLATESHRSGCPYSDTNEDGSPREARNGDRIREEGN